MMKSLKYIIICIMMLSLAACQGKGDTNDNINISEVLDNESEEPGNDVPTEAPFSYVNPKGKTLEKRINIPAGFTRVSEEAGSFGSFVRNYKLKKDGSPVLLYNGSKKGNQSDHVCVFKLPIENEDLQQCADSVMRIYGEYYYGRGEYDKIRYSLGGGFVADFAKWSSGYGISVNGDNVSWSSSPSNNYSYESFKKFMRMVFAYSGTMNLEADSKKIKLSKLRIGDIFIKGASPGHVVMVADICEDTAGNKAFLLAQGYMPAQEFHIIKNPRHENDPWYYENEVTYPFVTAEYTFEKGSLRRPDIMPKLPN